MSFRQVVIRKSEKIRLSNNNLCVVNNEKEVKIPLEDIFIVLIEDPNTIITTNIISKCVDNRICIITCDEKHLPCAMITGYNQHHRALHVMHSQLNQTFEMKSQIWKQLIKSKIYNQYLVAKYTSNVEKDTELLKEYTTNVKDGDIDNREGIAAKVFFKSVYGTEFIRFYDDGINHAMNYGYTIIASAITRELIAYGIDPKFGIWHDSKANSFNLSYDIVEVFRPLVDYCIYENMHKIENELTLEMRKELIKLLNVRVDLEGKMQTVQYCITRIVKSYVGVIEGKRNDLVLPKIEKVDFYISE
ncbi:MAG: type II CRISPR-associated endonuclease Cas1 [Bacilli bacterium]